ncbi:hypothetical protein [Treponema sp.]|uniref:hypothetical protein n=1 Tax=Treponema sp. TaxID=166 RepID=UPI003F114F29
MTENKELTKIERELVLQYLIDDNVPLTVTLEQKPEKSDVEMVGEKIPEPEKEKRVPASAVFPVAIPSEQIKVLNQGVILLKNPARTVLPFLGKRVKVQFYFNHLGLYFITEMKECSQGLAIVIPQCIRRIPEIASKTDYDFSGKISYKAANCVVSFDCLPENGYRIFSAPKWSDLPEDCQREAKMLLEKFVQEVKEGRTGSIGNGVQLLSIVRYLTDKPDSVQEPVEGRVKPFYIIFADDKRIVLAGEEGSEMLDPEQTYNLSLYFSLAGNKLLKRTIQTKCSIENIYEPEIRSGRKCVSLRYENLKEEDVRFLYERITGKLLEEEVESTTPQA